MSREVFCEVRPEILLAERKSSSGIQALLQFRKFTYIGHRTPPIDRYYG